MKRRIFISLIVIIFDIVLLFGFGFTNKLIQRYELMILFNDNTEINIDTVEEDEEVIEPITIDQKKKDKLVKLVNPYFVDSILENKASDIIDVACKYGVDPYLFSAIVVVNNNNSYNTSRIEKCFNIGVLKGNPSCMSGSYKKYNNIDEGLEDFALYLYANFIKYGNKTPIKIYLKYGKGTDWCAQTQKYLELFETVK